jgi:hypothetical protein
MQYSVLMVTGIEARGFLDDGPWTMKANQLFIYSLVLNEYARIHCVRTWINSAFLGELLCR